MLHLTIGKTVTKVNLDVVTSHNNDGDDDGGRWSYRGTTSGYVSNVYVSDSNYNYSYRGFETPLDPPFYVVYAEYTTGDTFGSDFEACIVGVEKDAETADALATEARNKTGFGELSNGFYVPWNGYFEHLDSIHVRRVS